MKPNEYNGPTSQVELPVNWDMIPNYGPDCVKCSKYNDMDLARVSYRIGKVWHHHSYTYYATGVSYRAVD